MVQQEIEGAEKTTCQRDVVNLEMESALNSPLTIGPLKKIDPRYGSEEIQTPSTVASILRFGTIPANPIDSAIEADNEDLAVDTRAGKDPQEVQSLWQLKLSVE